MATSLRSSLHQMLIVAEIPSLLAMKKVVLISVMAST